jgi:hypothetical protein
VVWSPVTSTLAADLLVNPAGTIAWNRIGWTEIGLERLLSSKIGHTPNFI